MTFSSSLFLIFSSYFLFLSYLSHTCIILSAGYGGGSEADSWERVWELDNTLQPQTFAKDFVSVLLSSCPGYALCKYSSIVGSAEF